MSNTYFFNPLDYPVYLMAKPVGALCNINCEYCYYLEKSELYRQFKTNRMSDQMLERYVEQQINASTTPEVLFTWHGGETLLRGIEFYRKALALQRKYGKGRTIDNAIQTNGLLINDEWCRFFKENNFLVGISIDGPEHVHNRYRVDRGGRGTFARVMRGIELLQKNEVEFNTLSVISNISTQYPLEIYHFFKEIGSQYMQFSPIVERIGNRSDGLELVPPVDDPEAELAEWSVDAESYGDFYIQIFDEWVRNDVGKYYVQQFDATLANLVGVAPGVCLFAKTCGHAAAMEFNGDVYACDHFVFPEYKRGNLQHKTLVEMMVSEEQIRFGNNKRDLLPLQCRSCKHLALCNGECPKNRILYTKEGEPGLNYLCKGLTKYFEYTTPFFQYMANELSHERPPANIMEYLKSK